MTTENIFYLLITSFEASFLIILRYWIK